MKNQMEMFPSAKAKRDEALAMVAANSGKWNVKAFCQAMLEIGRHRGESMTGEQLRFLIAPSIGEPHHHNAWGALIRDLIRHQQLMPTRNFVHMQGPKSNARMTRVYILTPKPEG